MKLNAVFIYMLFLIITNTALNAQSNHPFLNHHTNLEINFNAIQLNASIVDDIWGGQFRLNYFLHEQIELVNNTGILTRSAEQFFQNDLRLRLWGGGAGSWHPGFAVEFGHLYQNEDWLNEGSETSILDQHGFLFGGTWYFPLTILNKGFVVSKWAYVLQSKSKNMTIFNCYVHWNVTENVAIHIGGDIYTKHKNLKYSGFIIGLAYQIH